MENKQQFQIDQKEAEQEEFMANENPFRDDDESDDSDDPNPKRDDYRTPVSSPRSNSSKSRGRSGHDKEDFGNPFEDDEFPDPKTNQHQK